jgi:hypothetical protein
MQRYALFFENESCPKNIFKNFQLNKIICIFAQTTKHMQVFIPFSSPIQVAKILDSKRRNKQIIECKQILKAINGTNEAWKNHPVVKMYSSEKSKRWLYNYMLCLDAYNRDDINLMNYCGTLADRNKPDFINDKLCDQHKRRLYTKDPIFYSSFAKFGKSEDNWYIVNGEKLIYRNGKLINKETI